MTLNTTEYQQDTEGTELTSSFYPKTAGDIYQDKTYIPFCLAPK